MKPENAPLLAVTGGGLLVCIGVMLPWVSVATGFGSVSRSGLDFGGDGYLIGFVGVAAFLMGLGTLAQWETTRWVQLGGILGGLLAVALMGYQHKELLDRVDAVAAENLVASVGAGVWVVYLGGLMMIAGGIKQPPSDVRIGVSSPEEEESGES